MQLVYCKGAAGNFGDELNAMLWPRLAPSLFRNADRTGFLGIGTIIGMPTPGCDFLHVFSSGIGYDRLSNWRIKRRIWCVRGPLSARLLDCEPDAALTDGAVLAPVVLGHGTLPPEEPGIGVVPHWESLDHPDWDVTCAEAGMALISPIGAPDAVIARIRSKRLIIAELLHGAILADAYGIPWVAIASTANVSRFKWTDWALSLGLSLRLLPVPPPSADALLRFGRFPSARSGDIAMDAERAMAEYGQALNAAPAASVRSLFAPEFRPGRLASRVRRSVAQRALKLGPSRTAEALTRAARLEPSLSTATRRDELQDRMLGRLRELCRAEGAELAA